MPVDGALDVWDKNGRLQSKVPSDAEVVLLLYVLPWWLKIASLALL
jgi:hypothetical protein